MSILHKVINIADDLLDYISSANRNNLVDYCDLEAPNDENTFVTKEGAYGSIIEVRGTFKNLSIGDFHEQVADKFAKNLKPFMYKKGYGLQIFYSSNPYGAKEIIETTIAPNREASKRLGLEFDPIYDSRSRVLERVVNEEKVFVVVWTSPEVLTKQELQEETKGAAKVESRIFGVSKDSLDPYKAIRALDDKHYSFFDSVYKSLVYSKLDTKILNVKEASREIRKTVDLDTDDLWQPILPGEPILPAVRRSMPERKIYDGMLPKFGWQLMPKDAVEINDKIEKIGDYLFASNYVDIMPAVTFGVTFNKLCDVVNAERFPWRCSFLLEGDGLSGFAMKKVWASVLYISNKTNNKLIQDGIKYLDWLQEQDITAILQVRMTFTTWARAEYVFRQGDKEASLNLGPIKRQIALLNNIVKTWEGAEVIDTTGDPLEAALSTSLALKRGSIGTKMAAPLSEVAKIMPFNRVVSPWEKGCILFTSAERKLIPVKPFSKIQDTFISLIWAPPGAGKSVLLNYLNTGLCMDEDNKELPFIRTLDVGESSFGFAVMMQNALPEDQKHLVVATRMRNTREASINPFDTKLGCRTPIPTEKDFLVRFMKLLVSDERQEMSKGMSGLIDSLVPAMYEFFSDLQNPKKYTNGFNRRVDAALSDIGFKTDENTTWWQVVDALFLKDRILEANMAHYYAMPLLADATSVLTESPVLKEYYKITKDSGNEDLIKEFERSIMEVLEKYPLLSDITKVDFANARIVNYDLDEVLKSGGSKETTIFYMLARFMLAKDFFVDHKEAVSTPATNLDLLAKTVPIKKYQSYHAENFKFIRESKKRLNLDEFHKTGGSPIMIKQVEDDFRLGRKYAVDIILATQTETDFTRQMLEFTSATYIMDNMNEKKISEMADIFDFNSTERIILKEGLKGPNRYFLARYKINNAPDKWASFKVSAILSPEELWAYNTTALNAAVRNSLYERVGQKQALKILAHLAPSGNLDARKAGLGLGGETAIENDEKAVKNQADLIAQKMQKEALQMGLIQP